MYFYTVYLFCLKYFFQFSIVSEINVKNSNFCTFFVCFNEKIKFGSCSSMIFIISAFWKLFKNLSKMSFENMSKISSVVKEEMKVRLPRIKRLDSRPMPGTDFTSTCAQTSGSKKKKKKKNTQIFYKEVDKMWLSASISEFDYKDCHCRDLNFLVPGFRCAYAEQS